VTAIPPPRQVVCDHQADASLSIRDLPTGIEEKRREEKRREEKRREGNKIREQTPGRRTPQG